MSLGNKLGDNTFKKKKKGGGGIASTKVFCILFLFSSKAQDVSTDYFAFYNISFFFVFFDSEFGLLLFCRVRHHVSRMFTGGSARVGGHCSSAYRDNSNRTIAILILVP